MDLFKDWELLDTRIIFIYKRIFIDTVLKEALKTIHFDHIIVSKKLLKLFVFMSERACASHLTVLFVIECTAFCWFAILFLLFLRIFGRVIVCTVLTELASASFCPVVANFFLLCFFRRIFGIAIRFLSVLICRGKTWDKWLTRCLWINMMMVARAISHGAKVVASAVAVVSDMHR